ncbi:hypothetical protein ACWEBH_12810, partial [Micrococcus endophyticus]
ILIARSRSSGLYFLGMFRFSFSWIGTKPRALQWHHSVIDAGPTPNNVRKKAKREAGQFEPRSVLDVIASLDDMAARGGVANPLLPKLAAEHDRASEFMQGLARPQSPRDHARDTPR